MTCRGFQYEEGKTYKLPDGENAKLCESGFHACEAPLDCFGYYSPGQSEYHEVELDAIDEQSNDGTKRVGKSIRIGCRLNVAGLVKAQVEYVKNHTTTEHTDKERATAGYSGAATAGDFGAATAGYGGAATAGDSGAATARGSSSSGEYGLSVARGNGVKVKGGLGAVLVICEEEQTSRAISAWKAVVVDGETIKSDTWYKLENGEFVVVEE